MAAVVNVNEATCWANAAESTRTRDAYKWQKVGDEWHRVRSVDDAGRPLTERIPQSAMFGTPLTGLRPAGLRTFVKVMYANGYEGNVMVAQGAAHDNGGDNTYERYMLGTKGRGEGWIVAGSCPVLASLNGDLQRHLITDPDVRASEAPCGHGRLGIRKPPCPHYHAEMLARQAVYHAKQQRMLAAFKSEEAKLLEGQVAVQQRTSEALVDAVKGMAETVREIREERATAPVKGGK